MTQVPLETYKDGKLVSTGTVTVPDDQANADTLRARADNAINALENAYGATTAATRTATPPPPQVLWLTVRVVIALARLVLGRTEAAP